MDSILVIEERYLVALPHENLAFLEINILDLIFRFSIFELEVFLHCLQSGWGGIVTILDTPGLSTEGGELLCITRGFV